MTDRPDCSHPEWSLENGCVHCGPLPPGTQLGGSDRPEDRPDWPEELAELDEWARKTVYGTRAPVMLAAIREARRALELERTVPREHFDAMANVTAERDALKAKNERWSAANARMAVDLDEARDERDALKAEVA